MAASSRSVDFSAALSEASHEAIAFAVLGFCVLQALFARAWVAPYSTPLGQLVLGILLAVFTGASASVRSLSVSDPEPRFLTSPDHVTEIASYKPHPLWIGGQP